MLTLLGLGFLASVSGLLTDGGVVVLKDADLWDKYVDPANNKVGMIEFYAPWCGHCQQFKPEYEKIAAEMVEHDIRVAKVDITEHKPGLKKNFYLPLRQKNWSRLKREASRQKSKFEIF